MNAKVKIQQAEYAPCSLAKFYINQIEADLSDFGEGSDEGIPPYQYWCGDYKFTADRSEKSEILEKYYIDYQDYLEICNLLEEKLHVGSCGCCE
jgi:hypothetical protein